MDSQAYSMPSTDRDVTTPTLLAALGLSWLGLAIHNVAELGAPILLRPETLGPTAVYLLLAAGWPSPVRHGASRMLLAWAWLNLIGGALLSVLPIPLWPFQPDQTLAHYAVHLLYAGLQVPLIVVLTPTAARP
jgi:hypothetical protein